MLDIVWRLAQGCVVSAEIAQTAGSAGTGLPDPMTAEEVAALWRVSPAYVRRLVRSGTLPTADMPGVIRIPRAEALRRLNPAA